MKIWLTILSVIVAFNFFKGLKTAWHSRMNTHYLEIRHPDELTQEEWEECLLKTRRSKWWR